MEGISYDVLVSFFRVGEEKKKKEELVRNVLERGPFVLGASDILNA